MCNKGKKGAGAPCGYGGPRAELPAPRALPGLRARSGGAAAVGVVCPAAWLAPGPGLGVHLAQVPGLSPPAFDEFIVSKLKGLLSPLAQPCTWPHGFKAQLCGVTRPSVSRNQQQLLGRADAGRRRGDGLALCTSISKGDD